MVVTTQGSGSSDLERPSSSDDEICGIISIEVAATMREAILEMCGSIKTTLIE